MDEQKIYQNMRKEIVQLSEERLERKLSIEELQHVNKDRSLIGLESVIDIIKFKNLNKEELEKFLIGL